MSVRPPVLLREALYDPAFVWPQGATPAASLAIYRTMITISEDLATLPYPGCAHVCDAITGAVAPRYFSARYAAAATKLRLHLLRRWNTTAAGAPTTTWTSADGGADIEIVEAPSIPGTLDSDGTYWDAVESADQASGSYRMASVTYALAPTLRTGQDIDNCAGWTVWVAAQHDDLTDTP